MVRIAGLRSKPEESGRRLWNLISDLNDAPYNFFDHCFIHNYCPLLFLNARKNNVAMSKLRWEDVSPVEEICNLYLKQTIQYLKCRIIVAMGGYAEKRALEVVEEIQENHEEDKRFAQNIMVAKICHPSPATRLSEVKWRERVKEELEKHPALISLVVQKQNPNWFGHL